MTRPTLAQFRELLDEHGFACSWSPMTEVRAAALHAALFPPALPHAQTVILDAKETSEAEATAWRAGPLLTLDALMQRVAPPEIAAFFAEHPEVAR
jgi:hypothetical protein